MNELLKPIHKAEERARTDEALERKCSFSLFFLVSKSPQKGDFLEQKYSVASFRRDFRATSACTKYGGNPRIQANDIMIALGANAPLLLGRCHEGACVFQNPHYIAV